MGIAISSSQVVKEENRTFYYQEYKKEPRLVWGSIEREVRRLCKELQGKGCKDFKIELVAYRTYFKAAENKLANVLIAGPIPLYVKDA